MTYDGLKHIVTSTYDWLRHLQFATFCIKIILRVINLSDKVNHENMLAT